MPTPPDAEPPPGAPATNGKPEAEAQSQAQDPTKVSCDSCHAECTLAPVTGPTLLRRTLPRGWRPRRIDGRVYILCDICGNLRQFVGGLSPYLQQRLGLPPNVEIEFPEHTELPDAWLNRSGNTITRK